MDRTYVDEFERASDGAALAAATVPVTAAAAPTAVPAAIHRARRRP